MRIEKLIKKHEIKTNSKDIKKGDIFVCTLGNLDKNKYIDDAIKKGCKLVITDRDIDKKVKYVKKDNLDLYLKEILELKYDNPLKDKTLIGITGTDGKTTTATILRYMLEGASIGTNGFEYHYNKIDLENTTPSLDYLYKYFYLNNKEKIKNIIMEVSSESYLTKRIPGLFFDVGIFLNISNEHLDKHKTFNNYLACKKMLLKNSKIKIINHDSKYFKEITKDLDNYLTFGKKKSDLEIIKYKLSYDKSVILFKYKAVKYKIESPLLGEYNVYNLCSCILCLLALGYEIKDILKKIKYIKDIPGRMEKISVLNKNVLIDYAHTEKATLSILKFLKKYSKKNIISIVGCAGGRYKEKRKLIGRYALKYSKIVIFTSDDYRMEDPKTIIDEMLSGSKKKNFIVILKREEAINKALNIARSNDLVLILGKGRDNYLAVGNTKIKYSDIDVLKKYYENNVK